MTHPSGMVTPPSSSDSGRLRRNAAPASGRRFGPYVVLEEIGRGGMGAVYRARHVETGVDYALKAILPEIAAAPDPDDLVRFDREAEVLARLDHPNIVRVHAHGVEGAIRWTAMDLVAGRSLEALALERPIEPRRASRLVAKVARAVDHAHGRGVLHRDLKPANVVVDEADEPHVLDFGLALVSGASRLTLTHQVVGTPVYMAPEQIDERQGHASLGPATDVYGLGGLLYSALTGDPPFAATDAVSALTIVLTEPPTPLRMRDPDLPAELDAICLRALEKDARARYPSAVALADDLERWLRGEATEARPPSGLIRVVHAMTPPPLRGRPVVTLALVGLLSVAAVAWFVSSRAARSAEAERVVEVERLGAELDAAFEAVLDGDVGACARADRAGSQLAVLLADGPPADALRSRLELVDGFRRAFATDRSFLMQVGRSARWSSHRPALLRALRGAGRVQALAVLMERAELTVEETDAIARGVIEGSLEPDAGLVEALLARIDAVEATAGLDLKPDEARALDERRVELGFRLLAAAVNRTGLEAATSIIVTFRPALRRLDDPPALPGSVLAALEARVDELIGGDLDAEKLALFEVVLASIDIDTEMGMKIATELRGDLLEEHGRSLATVTGLVVLHRHGAVTEGQSNVQSPPRAMLEARARSLVADLDDPRRADPVEAMKILDLLAEARRNELREEEDSRVRAGRELWWLAAPILEREWRRQEMSPWGRSRLATYIGYLDLDPDGIRERGPVEPSLAEVVGEEVTAEWVAGELHRGALERDRLRPILSRHVVVPIDMARWDLGFARDAWGGPHLAPAVDACIEALRVAVEQRTKLRLSNFDSAVDVAHDVGLVIARDDDAHGEEGCLETGDAARVLALVDLLGAETSEERRRLASYHLFRHHRTQEGLDLLVPHAADERFDWEAMINGARILHSAKALEDARRVLQRSLEFDPPGKHSAFKERAKLWRWLGEPQRAAADLARTGGRR